MATGTLLKSETVMSLVGATSPFGEVQGVNLAGNRGAFFSCMDEGGTLSSHAIPYDAWVDMGRPSKITVTVEPGDRLNQED